MVSKRLLLGFLIALFVLAGTAVWFANHKIAGMDDGQESSQSVEGNPDMVGQDVLFTVTEADRIKWELRVKRTDYREDGAVAILQGVEGAFYDENGDVVVRFYAPAGEYLDKDQAVLLTDGVLARSAQEEGSELRASRMKWSAKSDLVFAEGGVQLTKSGFGRSRASSCHFALDFSSFKLHGNIRTDINYSTSAGNTLG